MTVAQIEEKLEQSKVELSDNKTKLDELRSQRAKLLLDGKDTKEVDKAIFRLEHITTNGPAVITELENQLTAEQEKQKQAEHKKKLSQQKKAAKQIESLSKEFVDALGKAMDANDKLKSAFDQYNRLRRQTNESCVSKNVTLGSVDMLKWVFDFCKKELSGEYVMRTSMPPGCPQV